MPLQFFARIDPPLATIEQIFNRKRGKMESAQREQLRQLGRQLVIEYQEEAPKKTGAFAKAHFYRTYERKGGMELRMYSPEPLSKWIKYGTRPHVIVPVRARMLYFFWPKGPRGPRYYAFLKVHHPGTKPNRYDIRAWASWMPYAYAALRAMGRAYTSG